MKGHSLRKKEYIDPQFIYFLMISLITTLHLVLISRSNVPFFLLLLLQYSLCSSLSLSLSSQETRNRKKWRKLLRLKKAITGLIKDQGLLHFGDNSYIYIYIFLHYFWSFLDSMYPFLSHVCVCALGGGPIKWSLKLGFYVRLTFQNVILNLKLGQRNDWE